MCLEHGKDDAARTWLILKLLYCGMDPQVSTLGLTPLQLAREQEQPDSEKTVRQEVHFKCSLYIVQRYLFVC